MLTHERVVNELAALLAGYEAGVLEYPQVLGYRRLAHVETRGDLAGSEIDLRQIGENLAPRRRGDGFKNLIQIKVPN